VDVGVDAPARSRRACAHNTVNAAGVMPRILAACPVLVGRTAANRCRTSTLNPGSAP
jgi:hypothetical protein